jgi:hypothetical protein
LQDRSSRDFDWKIGNPLTQNGIVSSRQLADSGLSLVRAPGESRRLSENTSPIASSDPLRRQPVSQIEVARR